MRKLIAALFLIETKSELQEEPLPQAEIVSKASDILTETSENRMADWKLASAVANRSSNRINARDSYLVVEHRQNSLH